MSKHTPGKCWLWPDKTIGKKESRQLREEHNEVVNLNADMLEALEVCQVQLLPIIKAGADKGKQTAYLMVCDAIAKAKGEQ